MLTCQLISQLTYLNPVVRAEWHLLRDLDADSVCFRVLDDEGVGVRDHLVLLQHSRVTAVDGTHRPGSDANRLVDSQGGGEFFIR